MDTLISMQVFRQVAEGGSFVGASERLGISTAMTTKHVANLERRLGARLLNRTSRHVSLTEAGTVYYEHCRDALDMLNAAEASITEAHHEASGTLKVTAPVWCANRRIAKVLAGYRARHPKVVLDMRLENRQVDLVEEAVDLALRATREPSPHLIVRPICALDFYLVASDQYLARHGCPQAPAELEQHAAILPSYVALDNLQLNGPTGTVMARLTTAMRCNDSTLAYQSVLAGMGLAYLPDWLVCEDLAEGRLVRILPAFSTPPITLFAAYTSRKYMTPKVRSFIDFLIQELGTTGTDLA